MKNKMNNVLKNVRRLVSGARLLALGVLLCVLGAGTAHAAGYQKINVQAHVAQSGGGKIYIADAGDNAASDSGWKANQPASDQYVTSMDKVLTTRKINSSAQAQAYVYNQPANEFYEFKGWGTVDQATPPSGLQADVKYFTWEAAQKDETINKPIYAYFTKKKIPAFTVTYLAPERGSYTVDGAARPDSVSGLDELYEPALVADLGSDKALVGWYTTSDGGVTKNYFSTEVSCKGSFHENTTVGADIRLAKTGAAQALVVGDVVTLSDGSFASAWTGTSSSPGVATVTASGTAGSAPKINAVGTGSATITIINESEVWTYAVSVIPKPTEVALCVGDKVQFYFYNSSSKTWSTTLNGTEITTTTAASGNGVTLKRSTTSSSRTYNITLAASTEGKTDTVVVSDGSNTFAYRVTTSAARAISSNQSVTHVCTSFASKTWSANSANTGIATVTRNPTTAATAATATITGGQTGGSTTVTVQNYEERGNGERGAVYTLAVSVTKVIVAIAKTTVVGGTIAFTEAVSRGYYYKLVVDGGASTYVTISPTTATRASSTATETGDLKLTGVAETTSPVTVRLQQSSTQTGTYEDVQIYYVTVVRPTDVTLCVGDVATFYFGSASSTSWTTELSGKAITTTTATGGNGVSVKRSTASSSSSFNIAVTAATAGETDVITVSDGTNVYAYKVTTSEARTLQLGGKTVTHVCSSIASKGWEATSGDTAKIKTATCSPTSGTSTTVTLTSGTTAGDTTVTVKNNATSGNGARGASYALAVKVLKTTDTKTSTVSMLTVETSKDVTAPSGFSTACTWTATSSKTGVATVTVKNSTTATKTPVVTITPVGAGVATITVKNTSNTGSYDFTWTINLTVTAADVVEWKCTDLVHLSHYDYPTEVVTNAFGEFIPWDDVGGIVDDEEVAKVVKVNTNGQDCVAITNPSRDGDAVVSFITRGTNYIYSVMAATVQIKKTVMAANDPENPDYDPNNGSNATIRIVTHILNNPKPKVPNVLFFGTGCKAHGLKDAEVCNALNGMREVASVDWYVFGNWQEGTAKDGLYNSGHIDYQQAAKIDTTGVTFDNSKHYSLKVFYEWFHKILTDPATSNAYDYIVIETDGSRLASEYMTNKNSNRAGGTTASPYEEEVARLLKPFYDESRVIWIMDNGYDCKNYITRAGSNSCETDPGKLFAYGDDYPGRPYVVNNVTLKNSGEKNHYIEMLDDNQWRGLLGIYDPTAFLNGYAATNSYAEVKILNSNSSTTPTKVTTKCARGNPNTIFYTHADTIGATIRSMIKPVPHDIELADNVITLAQNPPDAMKIKGGAAGVSFWEFDEDKAGNIPEGADILDCASLDIWKPIPVDGENAKLTVAGNTITGNVNKITKEHWCKIEIDVVTSPNFLREALDYKAKWEKDHPGQTWDGLTPNDDEPGKWFVNPNEGDAEVTLYRGDGSQRVKCTAYAQGTTEYWDFEDDEKKLVVESADATKPYDGLATNIVVKVMNVSEGDYVVSYRNVGETGEETWKDLDPMAGYVNVADSTNVEFMVEADGYATFIGTNWVTITAAPVRTLGPDEEPPTDGSPWVQTISVTNFYNGGGTNIVVRTGGFVAGNELCLGFKYGTERPNEGDEGWLDYGNVFTNVMYDAAGEVRATNVWCRLTTLTDDGSENYEVVIPDSAEVCILPRPIWIESRTQSKKYDGTPLTLVPETDIYPQVNEADGKYDFAELPDGSGKERFAYDHFASITEVGGPIEATFDYHDGTAKVANYDVHQVLGKLTVEPPDGAINVYSGSETFAYDGQAHTNAKAWFVDDKNILLPSDTVVMKLKFASVTTPDEGEVTNVFGSVVITNSAGVDVTGNYPVFVNPGVLKVTNAVFSVRATGVNKIYDGVGAKATVTVDPPKGVGAGEPVVEYRKGATGDYTTDNPVFHDVESTDVWYRVSAQYYDTLEGKVAVKITPRPVTIKSQGAQKNYDTEPLEIPGFEITSALDFVEGETYETYDRATQTEVGETNATFKVRLTGNAKDGNYVVTRDETSVLKVIAADSVGVTSLDKEWPFDGTEHRFDGADAYTVTGTLLPGHGVKVEFSDDSKITYPGQNPVVNTISSIVITNSSGEDVTSQYAGIDTNSVGKLTIKPIPFAGIVSQGYVGVYDGESRTIALTVPEQTPAPKAPPTVRYSESEDGPFDLSEPPTYSNVCEKTVYFKVSADGYIATNGFATVKIDKRPILLKSGDAERTYDGEPASNGVVSVVKDATHTYDLVAGHTLGNSVATSAQYNQGSGDNVFTWEIVDGNGQSVKDNYKVDEEKGKLTVNRRRVEFGFTAKDKVYDGTTKAEAKQQSYTNSTVVAGESIVFDVSQMKFDFFSPNVGIHTVTGATYKADYVTVLKGAEAKNPTSDPSVLKGNYELVYVPETTAQITARKLTEDDAIVANDTNMVYGAEHPIPTYHGGTNVLETETLYVDLIYTNKVWDAGTYPDAITTNDQTKAVIISNATEDVTANYEIGFKPGKLTVTAGSGHFKEFADDPAERIYKGEGWTPEVAATNSVGEALEKGRDYTTEYFDNTNATEEAYVVITFRGNYEGTVTNYFTILPKSVTITSGDKTDFTYDGNPHAYTNLTAEGFVTGEGLAATTGWATVTTVAEGTKDNAFEYELKGNTLASNYDISVTTGKLAVVAAPIDTPEEKPGPGDGPSLWADPVVITYNGKGTNVTAEVCNKARAGDAFTYLYSTNGVDFVAWEALQFTNVLRNAGGTVGSYTVWYCAIGNGNYFGATNKTTVTVNPKAVTVTGPKSVKAHGMPDGSAQPKIDAVAITGCVKDADKALIAYKVRREEGEDINDNPGYVIYVTVDDAEQGNYTVSTVNGQLQIIDRDFKVNAENIAYVYNGVETNPVVIVENANEGLEAKVEFLLDDGTWSTTAPKFRNAIPSLDFRTNVAFRVTGKDSDGDLTPLYGSIVVSIQPREITLTMGSGNHQDLAKSKVYDGTPLWGTKEDIVAGGLGYAPGEEFLYGWFTNRIEVGINPSSFDWHDNPGPEHSALNPAGTLVSNYVVTPEYGWLKILPPENALTIYSENALWSYDGNYHPYDEAETNACYRWWLDDASQSILKPGDTVVVDWKYAKLTTRGLALNDFDYKIMRGEEEVTDEYNVIKAAGTFEMKNGTITGVVGHSVEIIYNGQPTNAWVEIRNEAVRENNPKILYSLDKAVWTETSPAYTHATEGPVSVWYAIEAENFTAFTNLVPLTVSVLPRPVEFESQDVFAKLPLAGGVIPSATKPLTVVTNVTEEAYDVIAGDEFAFTATNFLSTVGNGPAAFRWDATTQVSNDYAVTLKYGQLVVSEGDQLVVRALSHEFTFNGVTQRWEKCEVVNAAAGDEDMEVAGLFTDASGVYLPTKDEEWVDNVVTAVTFASEHTYTSTNFISGKLTMKPAKFTDIRVMSTNVVYDGSFYSATVTTDVATATVSYNTTGSDSLYWNTQKPAYRNANVHGYPIFYKVSAPGYETVYGVTDVIINPRPVTISSVGATNVFDGTGWTTRNRGAGALLTEPDPPSDEAGLIGGDKLDTTGSYTTIVATNACQVPNAFVYRIVNDDYPGQDLSANYFVTPVPGILVVNPCPFDLTLTVYDKPYDNTVDATYKTNNLADLELPIAGGKATGALALDVRKLTFAFLTPDAGENKAVTNNTFKDNWVVTNMSGVVRNNYELRSVTVNPATIWMSDPGPIDPDDPDTPKFPPSAGPFPGPNAPSNPPVPEKKPDGSYTDLSNYDLVTAYDGQKHTIKTNELVAAIKAIADGGRYFTNDWSLAYSLTGAEGSWQTTPFAWTDVAETPTSFWYRVAVPNYTNYVHAAGVIITQRVATVKSESGEWTYDGKPHSTNDFATCEGFVAGETYSTNWTATITDVGTTNNGYLVVFDGTAKESNYTLLCATGVLEVVEKDGGDGSVSFGDMPGTPYYYDGEGHEPKPTVHDDEVGEDLVEGEDFTYAWEGNTNATETAKVIVEFTGNYTGALTNEFAILPRSVTLTSADGSWTYDGKAHGTNEVVATAYADPNLGFVDGEGVTTNGFATYTTVTNAAPNAFAWEFLPNTLATNYTVTVVTGRIDILAAAITPKAPKDDNPEENPGEEPKPGDGPTIWAQNVFKEYDGMPTNIVPAAYNVPEGDTFTYLFSTNAEDATSWKETLAFTDVIATQKVWYVATSVQGNYDTVTNYAYVTIWRRATEAEGVSEEAAAAMEDDLNAIVEGDEKSGEEAFIKVKLTVTDPDELDDTTRTPPEESETQRRLIAELAAADAAAAKAELTSSNAFDIVLEKTYNPVVLKEDYNKLHWDDIGDANDKYVTVILPYDGLEPGEILLGVYKCHKDSAGDYTKTRLPENTSAASLDDMKAYDEKECYALGQNLSGLDDQNVIVVRLRKFSTIQIQKAKELPKDAMLTARLNWFYDANSGTYFARLGVACTNELAANLESVKFVVTDRYDADDTTKLAVALWDSTLPWNKKDPNSRAAKSTFVDGGMTHRSFEIATNMIPTIAEGDPIPQICGPTDDQMTKWWSGSLNEAQRNAIRTATPEMMYRTRDLSAGVGDYYAYVVWETNGTEYWLPVVAWEVSDNKETVRTPWYGQTFAPVQHSVTPVTMNLSLSLGVALEEGDVPTSKLTEFAVAGKRISGKVETMSANGKGVPSETAEVWLLGAQTPGQTFVRRKQLELDGQGRFDTEIDGDDRFFKTDIVVEQGLLK